MNARRGSKRAEDLLVAKAIEGLASAEEAELEDLLARHSGIDAMSVELAAAAIDLADAQKIREPLPDSLRAKLLADARAYFGPRADFGC